MKQDACISVNRTLFKKIIVQADCRPFQPKRTSCSQCSGIRPDAVSFQLLKEYDVQGTRYPLFLLADYFIRLPMGILFLLALLFAWPTGGMSLLIYGCFFVGRVYIEKKSKQHVNHERCAMNKALDGVAGSPSWMNSKDQKEIFTRVIKEILTRKKVPLLFCDDII